MSLLKYKFTKNRKNDSFTPKVFTVHSNIYLPMQSTVSATKTTDYSDNYLYSGCWNSKQMFYFTETYL